MQKALGLTRMPALAIALALCPIGCGGSSENSQVKGAICTQTFAACGGDPTGTWDIESVCLDGDLVAAYNANLSQSCANQITRANLSATGSATYGVDPVFSHPTVTYEATTVLQVSETYTPACALDVYGYATLDSNTCAQIEETLQNYDQEKQVTCSFTGTNCACNVTIKHLNTTTDTYAVNGSDITEGDASTYAFCVSGNTMTQRENFDDKVNVVTRAKMR